MQLIGQEEQERALLAAWTSGQMHHAWLLAGPRGVGKAGFARRAALFVLAGGSGDTLDVDPQAQAARLVAAGSHPDLKLLERLPREKDDRLAAHIVIDQVRQLQPALQGTPGLARWRAVIIDAADDLNVAAANALLKNLEEPPPNTLFLLVSPAPGRLLPTIRSRCRLLTFRELAPLQVRAALQAARPELGDAELDALARVAEGAPGRALRLADAGAGELIGALEAIAAAGPRRGLARATSLARSLSLKDAQPRYEALLELVPDFLARHARHETGPRLAAALSLWEKAHVLGGQALALSLDPQTVALELLCLVGALGELEDASRDQ
jgi:DNA polymerase-3 subunit delta'